jgi:hypothetical protein
MAGLELDLAAAIKRDLRLFATGRAGHSWGRTGQGLTYEGLAGLRWDWGL